MTTGSLDNAIDDRELGAGQQRRGIAGRAQAAPFGLDRPIDVRERHRVHGPLQAA